MTSADVAPAITVLMSCYNAAKWLDEAVASVLTQSFKDFEFLIIDDGSTDETLGVIRGYADRDARVVVATKPNSGLADSLNMGLRMARGEWIARIDADDICEPARLEKQVGLAKAHPDIVFVGSGLTEIDENGRILKAHRYPTEHTSLLKHLQAIRKFPPHSSAFYRRDVVLAIGGYRSRIRRAEDWDLWLRLSEVGELACLREPLVKIRKHAEQISHDDGGKRQTVDGRMAVVSYFLRQNGFPDPVAAGDEEFIAFRNWIEKRLADNRVFALESFRSRLRILAGVRRTQAYRVFKEPLPIVRQGALVTYLIWQHLMGERLPQRLAQDWIKKSCVAL